MFDDRSFDTRSFDSRSWFFGLAQAVYTRGRKVFEMAKRDIIQVLQRLSDMWVQKRG